MFASRMLLRVPGRTQTLYLSPQLRAFSLTRIALDPPKKAAPPPPPPPPPAPAPKRATKAPAPAPPVEPEKPVRKPRLVLSDKERDRVAKEKTRETEKVRAAKAKEKERLRAAKEKLRAKEKAAAAKQRDKERQIVQKEKEKQRQLAKKEKEKARELAKKEKEMEKKKAEKPYPPPPKRPLASYMLFAREFKTEPGTGVTQAAIEASEAWKTVSDAEKQGYSKKFEEAQVKYKANLADWIASLDHAQLAAARQNREPGTRDEASMKQLPKRPANGYALFLKDIGNRPGVASRIDELAEKEAGGDPEKLKKLKIGFRGRLTAEEWKTMSDKEKQVYQDKAADLKAAWNKNFGAIIAQQKEAQLSAMA